MPLDDVCKQYEHDGFIIIPELISGDECDRLKREAVTIFQQEAKPDASVYVHVSVVSELYRQLHKDPRIVSILEKIMPQGVMFLSDKIVVKTADKTFATPWHIDYFYWPETRPKVSIWMPLDDVNANNGTLTVVRHSQTKEWNRVTKGLPNGEFLYEVNDEEINGNDVVICTVKRGSAIVFSDRLVHGSTSNVARTDRYTIISTYHAPAEDEPFDLGFPAREIIAPTSRS